MLDQFNQGWCPLPVIVISEWKEHLVSCWLVEHHEEPCYPSKRCMRHHDCAHNGCDNPVVMDRYRHTLSTYLYDELSYYP